MPLGMDVDLSPGDFVLDGDEVPSPKRGRHPRCQIFSPCLLWPNGWTDQDGTWRGGRPRPTRQCVRWAPSSPAQIGGRAPSPVSGPCLLWPNGWIDQDDTWYDVGLSPGDFVLDVDLVPPPQIGGGAPKFSAHVYCGQTARRIKMALGTWHGGRPQPRRLCVR